MLERGRGAEGDDMSEPLLSVFDRPTYGPMQLPSFVDWELRLYLPRRIRLGEALTYIEIATRLERDLKIKGPYPVQWEANRSGMCICMSCGPDERMDILDLVNVVRKGQGLKLIK